MPFIKKNEMQELGRIIGKYLFPLLLTVVGLGIILSGSINDQTKLFVMGGVGIFLVGVISFLQIKGLINRTVQIILSVVFFAGAIAYAVLDYQSIAEQMAYERKREKIKKHVVQRLKDIRKAQTAYIKENEKYADSFDSLIYFMKNGKLSLVKKLGSLPDTVPTEEMALELGLIQSMPEGMTDEDVINSGLIVRDTIEVDVLDYVFDEDDRKNRKTTFYLDSLPYVPYADHKFEMDADFIQSGGVRQAVFRVLDPDPFDEQFILGSLTEASTSGNWKE